MPWAAGFCSLDGREGLEEENGVLEGARAEEGADVEVVEFGIVGVGVGVCGGVGGVLAVHCFGIWLDD